MQWSSDSKWIIQDINSTEDPSDWDSMYGCLAVRRKKSQFNWCFQWHSREENLLVDMVARLTFDNNLSFSSVNLAFSYLSFDMSDVMFSDSMGLSGL